MEHKYFNRGIVFCALLLILFSFNTFAQVGIGNTNPAESSLLDIRETNNDKGILIPRVEIRDLSTKAPITTTTIAEGLLVYNTWATTGKGFYYWNGTRWVGIDGGKDWKLDGNAGTTAATNFIGTTDIVALRFRTNNTDRFEMTTDGRFRAFATGTAAAPMYSWSSVSTMGMYGIGTNILGFSTASNERIRFLANGQVIVNATTPLVGDRFTVQGDANESAINGYTSGASTSAIYGSNTTATGFGIYGVAGDGVGVSGQSTGDGKGVQGSNTSTGQGVIGFGASGGVGVQGQNSGSGPAVVGISGNNGVGVQGESGANGDGVLGLVSGSGDGVYGQNTGSGNGVSGLSTNAAGIGVRATNTDSNGVGMVANGGNATALILAGTGATIAAPIVGTASLGRNADGTGLSGVGNGSLTNHTLNTGSGLAGAGDTGVFGFSTTAGDGTGVIGAGNNGDIYTYPNGSGVAGTGSEIGVYGKSTSEEANIIFGGYFSSEWGGLARVGGWVGLTQYKIIGNGNVSTIVKNVNEEPIIMFAPEAPEILFQDYGIGKLSNGTAVILIDPNFSKNIRVDENHPLKVFVTLEGDCNGVYVTEKSAQGFTVKELQNGNSNVSFSWQIVATRADERVMGSNGDVRISDNSVRFPRGPEEFAPVKRERISAEAAVVKNSKSQPKAQATPVKEEKPKEKQQSKESKETFITETIK